MYVPRRPLVRAIGTSRPPAARGSRDPAPAGLTASGDEVRAVVCATPRDRGILAEVDQLTSEGGRLRIGNEVHPRLPVGGRATVRLVHDGDEVTLEGLLVQLLEQPVARVLVFRWVGDLSVFAGPVMARFDRRLAIRVVPPASSPIRVVLAATDREPPVVEAGYAADLSTEGLGVLVSPRFDRAACALSRLTCGLTLPGSAVHHSFAAVVRHREWLPTGSIRYGLSFEFGAAARDRRARADILAWVQRHRADAGR